MKVRMKTIMCGPDISAKPRQVVDVSDDRAIDLVEGGFAEFVDEPAATSPAAPTEPAPVIETAAAPAAPETTEAADNKRGRKGR